MDAFSASDRKTLQSLSAQPITICFRKLSCGAVRA